MEPQIATVHFTESMLNMYVFTWSYVRTTPNYEAIYLICSTGSESLFIIWASDPMHL